MTGSLLQRRTVSRVEIPAVVLPDEDEELMHAQVVRRTEKVFPGFKPVRSPVPDYTQQKQWNAFAGALDALGIQPFVQQEVDLYKAAQTVQGSWSAKILVKVLPTLVATLLLPSLVWCAFVLWGIYEYRDWSIAILFLLALPTLLLSGILMECMGRCQDSLERAEWTAVFLPYYRGGEIPEFVHQTACDLGEACRDLDLRFYVDELRLVRDRQLYDRYGSMDAATLQQRREEQVTRKLLDPFLFVEFQGQRFYLEVWNEPGFRQKRVS